MATYSGAERVQIRQFTGYPNVLLDRNSRLESAMDLTGADVDAVAAVRAILAAIVATDTALTAALKSAGLKRAEDIEWYEKQAILSVRGEGRRHCSRLSQILGVPLAGDYFGEGGYGGDDWRSTANQYGGPIPLG